MTPVRVGRPSDEGLVLRARGLTRGMGVACLVVGAFFVIGGVVATATGNGVDNLINTVAGLVFCAVGFDMTRACVAVNGDGVRVRRSWRGRFIPRKNIVGAELGVATGMYVPRQRTVVLLTEDGRVPLLPLSRYGTRRSEQLLEAQRRAVLAALEGGRG